MSFASNPFIVLTYVSGPAVLTNASVLFLMSTTNRFARAIDRARYLAEHLKTPTASLRQEIAIAGRRVRLIAMTMNGLYIAAATFALATLMVLAGAALENALSVLLFDAMVGAAILCGLVGLVAFVVAAWAMVIESRLAMRAVAMETRDALALVDEALT